MSYFLRVLTKSDRIMALLDLRRALERGGFKGKLKLEEGAEGDWTRISLSGTAGTEIASIERNPVLPGSLGGEDIKELEEELEDAKPETSAKWLAEYLPLVRTVYAFEISPAIEDEETGWAMVWRLQDRILLDRGGILQADNEGFTNEDGCHILWQFPATAQGPWKMALLVNGGWKAFEMDLENQKQRDAFLRGEIPDGARGV